jgi:nicotinate-nucleotide adenylyltransferase
VNGPKVGLFGGSFDPIHRGHLLPVERARQALGLERVIYLPTAVPPHKPRRALAPPHARLAMVELALLGEEGLYASAFELTPERPAYTVDTVAHFRRELPGAELYLLIGSDSFAELDHWLHWREILDLARLAVLTRPGWEIERLALPAELAALAAEAGAAGARGANDDAKRADDADHAAGPRVHLLHLPPVEGSSTRLRELLGRGEEPPPNWVPPLVLDYIRKYNLYR